MLCERLGDGPVVGDKAYEEEFEKLCQGDEERMNVVEGHESVGKVMKVEGDLCVGEVERAGEEEEREDWEDWRSVEDNDCWVVMRGEMKGVEEGFGIVEDFF